MKINKFLTYLKTNSIYKSTPTDQPIVPESIKKGVEHSVPVNTPPTVNNIGNPEGQRLTVLRMLADKKISIKEAQGLLEALEGDPELPSNAHYL